MKIDAIFIIWLSIKYKFFGVFFPICMCIKKQSFALFLEIKFFSGFISVIWKQSPEIEYLVANILLGMKQK